MKIKRYMAVSMRVALAQVRAEQGPDAVILSSRRVEEGIEVIAAVDYDEALFADATLKRPAAAAPPLPRIAAAPVRAQPTRGLAPPPGPPGIEWVKLTDLEDPVRPMLREPLQARVIEELTAMDIAPDIAAALAAQTPQRTTLKDPSHIPLALLVKHLRVVDKLSPVNGGLIALVGPTGAGKTTTIGKLAARWSMQHGTQDLALVSTDSYRIGAREQLTTYARILGAPMHAANSGKELAQVLERLKTKKLVLIDTAGMGPRDTRLTEQIAALQLGAARARVLLTLPAHGEAHAMDEIVRSFARMSPVACVLTKLDEAASLGAVISTALRHRLRIAYLCNGQRVPEDLHAAHEKRVWLVRSAVKLKEHARPRVDDGHFARNVAGAQAHA
ncbi:MAG: flagellar biosynthesis protein FlhF [Pseudomonadota bacterium]|nr:flagellar biosynthesis protein FlhF [Pseudomonadota bacterium]